MGVRESEGLFWGAAIYPGAALKGPAQLSLCSQASSREGLPGSFCPGLVALQPLSSSHSSSTSAWRLTISVERLTLDSREAGVEGSGRVELFPVGHILGLIPYRGRGKTKRAGWVQPHSRQPRE